MQIHGQTISHAQSGRRAALIIEIDKARYLKIPFKHKPSK
jgi:hypothetical protein